MVDLPLLNFPRLPCCSPSLSHPIVRCHPWSWSSVCGAPISRCRSLSFPFLSHPVVHCLVLSAASHRSQLFCQWSVPVPVGSLSSLSSSQFSAMPSTLREKAGSSGIRCGSLVWRVVSMAIVTTCLEPNLRFEREAPLPTTF